MKSISWKTAEHMMNIVSFTVIQSAQEADEPIDIDDVINFSRNIFMKYCEVEGITNVEEPEEDDEEWEEDEEEE